MLNELGRFGDPAREYVEYEDTSVAQLVKTFDGPAQGDESNLVCTTRRAGSSAPRHDYQGLWASNMPHWKQWFEANLMAVYRQHQPEPVLVTYRYCTG